MNKRGSGILLHVTSLPSPYGIGDLGPWAYQYADFLSQTKQSYWQVLPLNPTYPAYGNSPYSSISTFAGNTLLISPDLLSEEGLLSKTELEAKPSFSENRCEYSKVIPYKERLFEHVYDHFKKTHKGWDVFEAFCSKHSSWLEDFSLFAVIKKRLKGQVWNEWPKALRDREPQALEVIRKENRDELVKEKFLQYLFLKQWCSLKDYCNQRGVQLLGDLPIYVNFDSADVWTNPHLFKLDEAKRPSFVAGVPPDYFSETGQLWGNPVYQWDTLREKGFDWWIKRMAHHFDLFDIVRIDHFRGLVSYWEVPAAEKTAINGKWVDVPVEDFFNALLKRFFSLPIIAEDLGLITPAVREVLHHFGFPGMKVLLFAFSEDHPMHPYLPHTYGANFLAYTGTHDNNTVRGWFEREAIPDDKRRLFRYLGGNVPVSELHWAMIRLAMMSVANMVIFPMQDILGLGEEARMNRPSIGEGNWEWRLLPGQLTPAVTQRLLEMTKIYGRA